MGLAAMSSASDYARAAELEAAAAFAPRRCHCGGVPLAPGSVRADRHGVHSLDACFDHGGEAIAPNEGTPAPGGSASSTPPGVGG